MSRPSLLSTCRACGGFLFSPLESVTIGGFTLCHACLAAFPGGVHCGREPPQEGEYYEDLEAYYVMKSVHNK
jgi:hypothetical protein